jgi:hypothetical protein
VRFEEQQINGYKCSTFNISQCFFPVEKPKEKGKEEMKNEKLITITTVPPDYSIIKKEKEKCLTSESFQLLAY